jgi:S-adenosylmethionine decarboxylase
MVKGKHVVLDCFGCKGSKLWEKDRVKKLLESLVKTMNSKKIFGPVVFKYEHSERDKSGVTGFVVVADSHASVHTWPLKDFAFVDAFSCAEFDENKVRELVKKSLGAKRIAKRVVNRG